MMSRIRAAVLLLASCLLASLMVGAPSVASASDSEMSVKRAGKYYLKVVCKANKQMDKFDRVLLGKKDVIYYKDYKGKRLEKVRKAADPASDASFRAGAKLENPPADWPAEIESRVEKVSRSYLKMSDQFDNVAYKGRSRSFDAVIETERIAKRSARHSKRVRAFLNLPRNGKGC